MKHTAIALGLCALAFLAVPDLAHAATTGGTMPWDGPLTTLRNDLTGPVAFTISLLAFLVCGVAVIFGGEMSHFVRGLFIVVMVASMLGAITNVASALGITGAMVL